MLALTRRLNAMTDISPDEMREIVRRAIGEWMDAQFSQFSRWTLKGLIAAVFAGICWLIFEQQILSRFPLQHLR